MFLGIHRTQLVTIYGVWAVLFVVTSESRGVPMPGETMLLVAAVYAGAMGHLTIALVIAAAAGAVTGDNLSYLIGRLGGERWPQRVGLLATGPRRGPSRRGPGRDECVAAQGGA